MLSLINIQTLCKHTTLCLIIINNLSNKVCIPKEITNGTSEKINTDCCNMSDIILRATIKDIKIDDTTHAKPVH